MSVNIESWENLDAIIEKGNVKNATVAPTWQEPLVSFTRKRSLLLSGLPLAQLFFLFLLLPWKLSFSYRIWLMYSTTIPYQIQVCTLARKRSPQTFPLCQEELAQPVGAGRWKTESGVRAREQRKKHSGVQKETKICLKVNHTLKQQLKQPSRHTQALRSAAVLTPLAMQMLNSASSFPTWFWVLPGPGSPGNVTVRDWSCAEGNLSQEGGRRQSVCSWPCLCFIYALILFPDDSLDLFHCF